MAQEHKVPMICLIFGKLCDFFHDIHTQRLVEARLKVQAHCHRPGAVHRSRHFVTGCATPVCNLKLFQRLAANA
jgi:hypothetical protein